MKKIHILMLFIFVCVFILNADEVLKPDTNVILKDKEYVYNSNGKQLWVDLNQYEAKKEVTCKVERTRDNDLEIVNISMPYDVQKDCLKLTVNKIY